MKPRLIHCLKAGGNQSGLFYKTIKIILNVD